MLVVSYEAENIFSCQAESTVKGCKFDLGVLLSGIGGFVYNMDIVLYYYSPSPPPLECACVSAFVLVRHSVISFTPLVLKYWSF